VEFVPEIPRGEKGKVLADILKGAS